MPQVRECALEKKTLRLEQVREEKELMMMDTSAMDEIQQEYVRRGKMAVFEGQNIILCF